MKSLFLILLLVGSFALADNSERNGNGVIGIVRILGTNPVRYNKSTGAIIPDSQNTIIRIKDILFDENTAGHVALVTTGETKYESILVVFDDTSYDNIVPQEFGEYVTSSFFQINIEKSALTTESGAFKVISKVNAEDLKVYSDRQHDFINLKNAICPVVQQRLWVWHWGKSRLVRKDCL